jgi:hypothetical protein
MADAPIATYLRDHLAGSTTAIELLEHLEKERSGTELEPWAAELRADVEADRRELESLLERLNVTPSTTRQAFAWLGEKAAEIKLRLDDSKGGALYLLEALEALALGIEGKGALWRSLAAVAESTPELRGVDFGRLERRADEQSRRVETMRLEAARLALAPI